MADDGETKDDVKVPDGETGEKIKKLFQEEEKDTSKLICTQWHIRVLIYSSQQTLLSLPPWVNKLPLKPRRLPVVKHLQSLSYTTEHRQSPPKHVGGLFSAYHPTHCKFPFRSLSPNSFTKKNPQKENTNESESKGPGFLFFSLNFSFFLWLSGKARLAIWDFCILFSSRGSGEYGCGGWWMDGNKLFFLASSYFYHYYSLNVTGKFEHPRLFSEYLLIDDWMICHLNLGAIVVDFLDRFTPKRGVPSNNRSTAGLCITDYLGYTSSFTWWYHLPITNPGLSHAWSWQKHVTTFSGLRTSLPT